MAWPVRVAVFPEPPSEPAGAAHGAQPPFGPSAHSSGGDDKQPVTGLQGGSGPRNEPLLAADDQGDIGLGGQPELEDLHAL
jgi:hypothetical protein